jgi:hypothetical protein
MMAALVNMVALLAMIQAPITVLPKGTCRIKSNVLAGTTIELVSDFAPFLRETFDRDGSFEVNGNGMLKSGRWYSKGEQVCAQVSDFTGCGQYRADRSGNIYVISHGGGVAKYVQREGGSIKCH